VVDADAAGADQAASEGHKKGKWDDAIETVSLYGTMMAKQAPQPFNFLPSAPCSRLRSLFSLVMATLLSIFVPQGSACYCNTMHPFRCPFTAIDGIT
jgi:hypothetical protein